MPCGSATNPHLPLTFHIFTSGLDDPYSEMQKSGAKEKQGILEKP
jgi:hypothetical protein